MFRIPVANVIAILAGRRALIAYLKSLAGQVPQWDKTHHDTHPAIVPVPLVGLTTMCSRAA